MRRIAVLLIAAVAALNPTARAEDTTYYFGHHEKFINITFESNADLETIVGTTNKATGQVVVSSAKDGGAVSVTVPVASLKTGIDGRDEHLRTEKWLDAAKFPNLSFTSTKVEKEKDSPNRFKVTGNFSLHGVSKEMTISVEAKSIPADVAKTAHFPDGEWLRFTAEFPITLSDFGVKIPEGGESKVADTWTVRITLFAGVAKPEEKK